MKTNFEIEFRGDHLHILLGPDYDVNPEQEDEFWSAVEQACAKHGTHRVLLEGNAPKTDLKPAGVASSGIRAAAAVPRLWFAICLKDFEETELSELYATVAASRGVHVKFFSDSEKALNWLRANSPA